MLLVVLYKPSYLQQCIWKKNNTLKYILNKLIPVSECTSGLSEESEIL